METLDRRPVLMAVYPVAALLVLVPTIEVTAGAWPFQPSELSWRFGVGGIALKTVVTPLLGLLLAMVAGALLEHRRAVRALSVLCFLAALGTTMVAVFFALDFLQLRGMVEPRMRQGMTVASGTALLMAVMVTPAALALGMGGWKATRRAGAARARTHKKSRADDLLVTPRLKENAT